MGLIYYGNPSTDAVRDAMAAGLLGCINTPHQGNVVFPEEWDMIADNGCFSDRWTEGRWWRWLIEQPRRYRFAVCPDVFLPDGRPCHDETVERWHRYSTRMRVAGFTPAFVCQVGSNPDNVPPDAEVLFLGGDDAFKLGVTARAIAETHCSARWIHMGRVNTLRRLRHAQRIGCHSVDGTCLTVAPDLVLPDLLHFLRTVDNERHQLTLDL